MEQYVFFSDMDTFVKIKNNFGAEAERSLGSWPQTCIYNNYSTKAHWIRAFRRRTRCVASNRLSYHKLIYNKVIKYQTLDRNISNFAFYQLEFVAILREIFPWCKILSVAITGHRIYTVSRKQIKLPDTRNSTSSVWYLKNKSIVDILGIVPLGFPDI